jgi:hypothetical protein
VFRVEGPGVVVEQHTRNEILRRVVSDPLPFRSLTETVDPLPTYVQAEGLDNANCSNSPRSDLCILDPEVFADEQTFIELIAGDVVYIPANSTCFFCNISGINSQGTPVPGTPVPDANTAVVQIWAPGQPGSTWYDLSQRNLEAAAPTQLQGQGLHDVRGWMLNPGSPCH